MNQDEISNAISSGDHSTEDLLLLISESLPSDQKEVLQGEAKIIDRIKNHLWRALETINNER